MKSDVRIEFGSEATNELKRLVGNARKNLLIVSPWLSSETANLALWKHENDVNVRILTTASGSRSHLRALRNLIGKERRVKRKARPKLEIAGLIMASLGFFGVLILFLTEYLNALSMYVMIASIITGGVLFLIGRETHENRWVPKVSDLIILDPKPLLHAKIYVIDDVLAIGSANFTHSGLNRNIEALAFIRGEIVSETVGNLLSIIGELPPRAVPLEEVWRASKSATHKE